MQQIDVLLPNLFRRVKADRIRKDLKKRAQPKSLGIHEDCVLEYRG